MSADSMLCIALTSCPTDTPSWTRSHSSFFKKQLFFEKNSNFRFVCTKKDQIWQKHDINLTQTNCIIGVSECTKVCLGSVLGTACHILIRYCDIWEPYCCCYITTFALTRWFRYKIWQERGRGIVPELFKMWTKVLDLWNVCCYNHLVIGTVMSSRQKTLNFDLVASEKLYDFFYRDITHHII
jgi:hypothetical protein